MTIFHEEEPKGSGADMVESNERVALSHEIATALENGLAAWCIKCDQPLGDDEWQVHPHEHSVLIVPDHVVDLLRRALEALTQQGWQPIETAPEAERVWVYVPKCGAHVALKTTHPSDGAIWWTGQERLYSPTLWQPLPALPSSGSEGHE